MPCNSDYMNPTGVEAGRREAAKYLIATMKFFKVPVPKWVKVASQNLYGRCSDDETQWDMPVTELCTALTSLRKQDTTRLFANHPEIHVWWNEHREADKARIQAERETREKAKLKKQALAKLTPAERAALGY